MHSVLDEHRRDVESQIDCSRLSQKSANAVLAKRITVFFLIARDGSICNTKVIVSSGDKQMDSAAIDSIKRAAPFKPLPEAVPSVLSRLVVEYTFRLPDHSGRAIFRQL